MKANPMQRSFCLVLLLVGLLSLCPAWPSAGQALGVPGRLSKAGGGDSQREDRRAGALNSSAQGALERPVRPRRSSRFQRNGAGVKAAFQRVVSRARRSTVVILGDGKRVALGTVADADGYILTKASQLEGRLQCQLTDGRRVDAVLVGVHPDTDLAMVKAGVKGLPVIQWSDRTAPPVGSFVATPGLDDRPIAFGIVSVGPRPIPAPSGVLGILIDQDDKGPRVEQILPGSGAEKAGLRVNDIILSVNGKRTKTREQLIRLIRHYKAGDRVQLSIARGDQTIRVPATLGGGELFDPALRRADFQNGLGGPLSRRRAGFPSALQHDSFLRPNDCGGPLVDLDGKAVGINIARSGRVSSLALPVAVVKPLISQLKSGKLAPALASQRNRDTAGDNAKEEKTSLGGPARQ